MEYLSKGSLSLPMGGESRRYLCDIRLGKVPMEEVVKEIRAVESELKLVKSPLPPEPDYDAVAEWMEHAHRSWWPS